MQRQALSATQHSPQPGGRNVFMLINMPCQRRLSPLAQSKSSLPAKDIHMCTSGGALEGRPVCLQTAHLRSGAPDCQHQERGTCTATLSGPASLAGPQQDRMTLGMTIKPRGASVPLP